MSSGPNKRKCDEPIVDEIVTTKHARTEETVMFRPHEIILNTVLFRCMLKPDIKSIDSAVEYAQKVGRSGLNLTATYEHCPPFETVRAAARAIRGLPRPSSLTVTEWTRVVKHLFLFLDEHCVFNDSMACNLFGCEMARFDCAIPHHWIKSGLDAVHPGHDNALSLMMESNFICDLDSPSVLDIVAAASDRYINTPTRTSNGQLMTVLKAAVIYRRYHVVDALLRRMPAINFDLVHLDLALAEPLSVLTISDPGIKDLLSAGEHITTLYHRQLTVTVKSVLTDFISADLLPIVDSYFARMPLATTQLRL